MLDIRDDLGNVLATATTTAEADEAVEELCRRAHAQAVANGEGVTETWFRFEVVDHASGEMVAFRSYNPNPAESYESLGEEA